MPGCMSLKCSCIDLSSALCTHRKQPPDSPTISSRNSQTKQKNLVYKIKNLRINMRRPTNSGPVSIQPTWEHPCSEITSLWTDPRPPERWNASAWPRSFPNSLFQLSSMSFYTQPTQVRPWQLGSKKSLVWLFLTCRFSAISFAGSFVWKAVKDCQLCQKITIFV